MSKQWLIQRRECLVALAAALVALAVIAAVVVVPIRGISAEYGHDIERSAERLARLKGLIAQQERYDTLLEQVKKLEQESALYYSGQTPALVATQLQQAIDRIVTASGGEVSSIQVLNAEKAGPFTKVPIKVTMVGDTPFLQQVLHGFDGAEKLLAIDDMNVRARVVRTRRRANLPPEQQETQLYVQATIAGYMRGNP